MQLAGRGAPACHAVLDVVRRLTLLQVDPVAVIAPQRRPGGDGACLGASYAPAETWRPRWPRRTLLELRAMIRPAADLALYRADMAAWDDGAGPAGLAEVAARLGAGQRRVPPGHPRPAGGVGAAAVPRPARYLPGAVVLDRVDQPPQRQPAARVHGAAGRGRGRRAEGPRAAVGPGRSRLPGQPGRPRGRGAAHSGTSGGCAPWASPAPGDPSARSSRRTWARPASRP